MLPLDTPLANISLPQELSALIVLFVASVIFLVKPQILAAQSSTASCVTSKSDHIFHLHFVTLDTAG